MEAEIRFPHVRKALDDINSTTSPHTRAALLELQAFVEQLSTQVILLSRDVAYLQGKTGVKKMGQLETLRTHGESLNREWDGRT